MVNVMVDGKLCELFLQKDVITTKKLNELGLEDSQISELINCKVLKMVENDTYVIGKVDILYNYGKHLIINKEYEKADTCFERCFEIDPKHQGTNFQLFIRAIKRKNYDESLYYFEGFSNNKNPYYISDVNFYLYLLSYIMKLPEKYRQFAKTLTYDDIKIIHNDKRFSNVIKQNHIRSVAYNQAFLYANKLLNSSDKNNAQTLVTKILLQQIIELEFSYRDQLIELQRNKDYDQIIELLEKREDCHNLNTFDSCVLKMAREISGLQKGKALSPVINKPTYRVFTAISFGNYDLALNLSNQYNEKNNIDNSTNIINLLLTDIALLKIPKRPSVNNQAKMRPLPIEVEKEKELTDKEKEIIEEKIKLVLSSKDAVVLNSINKDKLKATKNFINKVPNVTFIYIENGIKVKMLLKHKEINRVSVDKKQLINTINDLFYNKKYNECIEQLKHFISVVDKPKAFVYAKMGISYSKIGNIKQAINYLMIANELNRVEQNGKDLSEFISKLKGKNIKRKPVFTKPYFKMDLEEFENKDADFGVKEIDEIKTLVFEQGLSILSACYVLKLNDDKIGLVTLAIARYLCIDGQEDKANELLMMVEKSEKKSKELIEQLEQVRRNKVLYRNKKRIEDDNRPFILKPRYKYIVKHW